MSDDSDLPDMTAAELALGVLEGEERAAALRRVLAEPEFAAEVARWREHFAQLFDRWPAVSPPTELLARIEGTLDGHPVSSPRRWAWPALAGGMAAAAAVLLVVFLGRLEPSNAPAPQPTLAGIPAEILVAAIAPGDGSAPVSAVYDPRSASLRLSGLSAVPQGRSAELWVIAGDGVPHSLGLMRSGAATAMQVAPANRVRLAKGAKLAISIEPEGGSKTGLPTGPVIGAGALLDA